MSLGTVVSAAVFTLALLFYGYLKVMEKFDILGIEIIEKSLKRVYETDNSSMLKWVLKLSMIVCLVGVILL